MPALFEQWPKRLLEAGRFDPTDNILDVGCGTGVVARAAFSQIESGLVVGLDPNPGMLAVAGRVTGVEWVQGVAEELPFDDASFDLVTCQFALMFFADRRAAIREMTRVLRPGGRMVVAPWAALEETPGYLAMVEILDRVLGTEAGDAIRAPYCLGNPGELKELLTADLANVSVRNVEGVARFQSIEALVHTDIRGWTLSEITDDEYHDLLVAAQSDLSRFTDEESRVSFAAPALIATGNKP